MTTEPRTVKVLFLGPEGARFPDTTGDDLRLNTTRFADLIGSTWVEVLATVAGLIADNEFDLVVVEDNADVRVLYAESIAETMRSRTIVFARSNPVTPHTQSLYERLGVKHFCTDDNLGPTIKEALSVTTIKATLKRTWQMNDFSKPQNSDLVDVSAGEYELERIANPHGHRCTCLVLKGTMIGWAEPAWLAQIGPSSRKYPEFEIILEENGRLVPALTEKTRR
jgi:hypothetical protein